MQFTLKPVFVAWSTLVAQLPLQIFISVWAGGFFGGMLHVALGKNAVLPVSPMFAIGGLTFVGVPIAVFIIKRCNYQKTEYRFFADRLEFEEGFFTINKKVIHFRDVKEVNMRQGILQRLNHLGTVYLATLATGSTPNANAFSVFGFGNTSASGISVKDVIDPDRQYTQIRALVDATNKSLVPSNI